MTVVYVVHRPVHRDRRVPADRRPAGGHPGRARAVRARRHPAGGPRPRRESARSIPYRRAAARRDWLWLVPVLIVAAFVGFGLSMAIEPTVINNVFGWMPDWFVRPIDPDRVGDYSREAWLVTLRRLLRLERVRRPDRRGAVLPRLSPAPDGVDGPLGAARQRQPLLALPLLVAVAGARQDPRASARRSTRCAGRRTSTSGWSSTAR